MARKWFRDILWACSTDVPLQRDERETGKMALGTGTHKGSPSWCPECAGRWD